MEILNVSPQYLDDRAFTPMSFRLAWTAGEKALHGEPGGRLSVATQFRVALYRATGVGAWAASPEGYAYSGVDGQGAVIYANPTDPTAKYFVELLSAWMPFIDHGVWWPKLEKWDGAAWVTLVGTNTYGADGFPETPLVVLQRTYNEETSRVRQGFPDRRYLAGPRTIKQES